jgi:hypothetical protein
MVEGLFTYGTLETMEVPRGGPTFIKGSTTVPKAPLGALIHYQGNTYRYVRFIIRDHSFLVGDIDQYSVMYWYILDPANNLFEVTPVLADAIAGGVNTCAGVSQHDIDKHVFSGGGSDFAHQEHNTALGLHGLYYAYGYIQVGGVGYAFITSDRTGGNPDPGDICVYSAHANGHFHCVEEGNCEDVPFGIILSNQLPIHDVTTDLNIVWFQNLIW